MIYARVISMSMMLFLLCFYIFSDTYIAFLLLSVMVLQFGVSFILYFFIKNKIGIDFKSDNNSMYKMQGGALHLIVKNKSLLPISRMKCYVQIHNTLVNEYYYQELLVSTLGKSKNVIPIQIKSEYVGKLKITLEKYTLYDLSGVLAFTKQLDNSANLIVLPNKYPISLFENSHYIESSDRITTAETKGIDSQEIIGLKEYEPTDNIKHVHWKLSSKLDQLVVKEIGEPLDSSYCIIIETNVDIDHPSKIDAVIESVYSLSNALLAIGHVHYIGWFDQRYHYFVLHEIYAIDILNHYLNELLSIQFHVTQRSSLDAYSQENQIASNVFYFTSTTPDKNSMIHDRVNMVILQCVIGEEEKIDNRNNVVNKFTPRTMKQDLGRILY